MKKLVMTVRMSDWLESATQIVYNEDGTEKSRSSLYLGGTGLGIIRQQS
jgi:hypothetical protein